jgi:citrate lyase beta subunit
VNNCYFFVPALKLKSLHDILGKNKIKMVVVDVEDSIHVKEKELALQEISRFDFSLLKEYGVKVGIRINSISTFFGLRDIQFLKSMDDKNNQVFEYIFLPKISSSGDTKIYRDLFQNLKRVPKLISIIETIPAVENVYEIASVSDALCFGKADLVALMYSPNEAYINFAQASICVAAAKNSILAIGTNSFEIQNMDIFERDCLILKQAGFTGMAAIHPNQVEIINKHFSVDVEEIKKLESYIVSYNHLDTGFLIVDGNTIAPPFVLKAKSMIKLYESMKTD